MYRPYPYYNNHVKTVDNGFIFCTVISGKATKLIHVAMSS